MDIENKEIPYSIWKIKKRNGSYRTIEAPNMELKKQQKDLIPYMKKNIPISPFAHAFQPYKNIVTMAMPHVNKQWVSCIDISNFFPSIKLSIFLKNPIHILSESDKKHKEIIRKCFYDFNDGNGLRLPQGAPTSPLLSNALLYRFDWIMAWFCFNRNCEYTRYADDIVVSGSNKKDITIILKAAESLLDKRYLLKVNHAKDKMKHRTKRQMVCGIVVNEKINLTRKKRKNLRAELHNIKVSGGKINLETQGRVNFHDMVHNTKKTSDSSMEICRQIVFAKKLKEFI